MHKDTRLREIHAIELEISGLDVELKEKRLHHQSLTIAIEHLERERHELAYILMRLKAVQDD